MSEASSIAIRVRRVTTEIAYVRVALTEEVVEEFNHPGKADAIIAEALREAAKVGARWVVEDDRCRDPSDTAAAAELAAVMNR